MLCAPAAAAAADAAAAAGITRSFVTYVSVYEISTAFLCCAGAMTMLDTPPVGWLPAVWFFESDIKICARASAPRVVYTLHRVPLSRRLSSCVFSNACPVESLATCCLLRAPSNLSRHVVFCLQVNVLALPSPPPSMPACAVLGSMPADRTFVYRHRGGKRGVPLKNDEV